jgi:hypothetical protein
MVRAKAVSCYFGALLMLVAPATASAQEDIHPPGIEPVSPPEGRSAPPGAGSSATPGSQLPAPPVPKPTTRYSRYRTSWYIGFGLSAGAGWLSYEDTLSYESESQGGYGFQAKVGWVTLPWLLLGVDLSAWRHDDPDSWIQFSHLDLVATIFPAYDLGLYGKGGIGVGVMGFGVELNDGLAGIDAEAHETSEAGFDIKLGAGYEWQLMTSFNLGADLTYTVTAHDGGRTHDLTAALTFTWY